MFGYVKEVNLGKLLGALAKDWRGHFNELSSVCKKSFEEHKLNYLTEIKTQARSNQIKHNDHEQRLAALEGMLAAKLKAWHVNLDRRERENAFEAEREMGVQD